MTDTPGQIARTLSEAQRAMKPQFCMAQPGEPGDCYRACLATITGIPASEIPNFNVTSRRDGQEDDLQFCKDAQAFLAPYGLGIFNTYCNGEWPLQKALDYFSGFNVGVPVILSGKPKHHPDPGHSVVALNGEIVHDPSGAGISGPCGEWWYFDVVALGNRRILETDHAR